MPADMSIIKPEWREAWRYYNQNSYGDTFSRRLINLSVHLLASWMRERFEREHEVYRDSRPELSEQHCVECGQVSNWDLRHNFTDADWDRVAREELGK